MKTGGTELSDSSHISIACGCLASIFALWWDWKVVAMGRVKTPIIRHSAAPTPPNVKDMRWVRYACFDGPSGSSGLSVLQVWLMIVYISRDTSGQRCFRGVSEVGH